MKTNIHFLFYLAEFFLEWEMFQIKVIDKIKRHILCSINFFFGNSAFYDNVEKYSRAEKAADDNMAHAHFMLDTKGYKYTLRIFNTYYFSTVAMVARTRLNDRLYVYCLSC
jgi:pyruvate kinase